MNWSDREHTYSELEQLLMTTYWDDYPRILEIWHPTKPNFRFYGALLSLARLELQPHVPPFNDFVRAYNKIAKKHKGKMMRYAK